MDNFDKNLFKNIQVETLDQECLPPMREPITESTSDLNLAGPSFSFVERNIENEILNSSTDNSSQHGEASGGEESDNGLVLGIDLSDVGTKILDRKRLRIFENITLNIQMNVCQTE